MKNKTKKAEESLFENQLSGAPQTEEAIKKRASRRLMSLDALRGLNMLCIIGLATLITQACRLHSEDFRVISDTAVVKARACGKIVSADTRATLAKHMNHVKWNGVLHHDTIFPLFLFLAGVSFPFSLRKQLANGRPVWRICLKILWRGFALVFLGIIYSNRLSFDLTHLRYMGVLQHIGLAWMFAAFIYLIFRRHKVVLGALAALILVGYWLVVALVPAPDVAPKEQFTKDAYMARVKQLFERQPNAICEDNPLPDIDSEDYPEIGTVRHNMLPEGCVVNYVDRKLVPGKLYHDHDFQRGVIKEYDPAVFRNLRDPEGLASTVPAIVTALLGMFFGGVLARAERPSRSSDDVAEEQMQDVDAMTLKITDGQYASKAQKLLVLTMGGVILMVIGALWHMVFPINKNLWNSSFVCFVGGYSALALALFYLLIDVLRLRWLGFPFAVVGMNSITIFLAKRIIVFDNMRDFFFADAISRFIPCKREILVDGVEQVIENGAFQTIATTIAGLIVSWLFLLWLYRRRIFMRV